MKAIESCWKRYRALALPASASADELVKARTAFFSGATVLFRYILMGLGDEAEPTEKDLSMMDAINTELNEFGEAFDRDYFEQFGIKRGQG